MDNGVENVSDLKDRIKQLEILLGNSVKSFDNLRKANHESLTETLAAAFEQQQRADKAEARLARYESQAVELPPLELTAQDWTGTTHLSVAMRSCRKRQLLDALRSLAVMREELDTLRHEKEFLIENNVKSMTLYRDELALRTQERDRLKERFSGLASDYLHEDDRFVIKFAIAMSEKLDKKRAEGYDGWRDECTPEFLAKSFLKHISKGDPVDVANFCMMLNYRLGGPRVMKEAFAKLTKERDALAKALEAAKELFELSEDCQEPGTDAYTWLHQAGLLINPPDALTERSKR